MNKKYLELLVCPECRAELNGKLGCPVCNTKYEIKGDIPILLGGADSNIQVEEEMFEKEYKAHLEDINLPRWVYIRKIGMKELEKLNLQGKKVLEIGCGFSQYLGKLGGDPEVGIDLSYKLIELRKRDLEKVKNGKEKSSGVFFVKANALKLPFRNECFDVVFGHGIFHHIPDLDAAFKESFRVLKKGGTLVALEPNMMSINGFYYYTRRLMHRLLGFKRLTKVVGFVTPEEKYLNALTLKRKLRKEFRDVDVYTISLIRLPPVGRIKKLNIEPLNRVLDLMFSWIPFNYFGSFCVLKAKK